MKTWILILFITGGFAAGAQQKQSLKDLLYSGKLKSDSGSVVRRDDDLSTKIDTASKKAAAITPDKPMATTAMNAPKTKASPTATEAIATDAGTTAETPASTAATPVKSNTKIWKEYTDSLLSGIKTEVLPNKKIKKDSYFVIVEYELGTDGKVNVLNVTSSPESPILQSEVKSRLDNAPPQLAPSLDSNGNPKKIKRKQSFTITKE